MQYYRIFYEQVIAETADYECRESLSAVVDEPTLFIMLLHNPGLRYRQVNTLNTAQDQWSVDTDM